MHLLWLKTDLLHPIDKGGKIRTYQMLRELRRRHHVTYLALDDGTAARDAIERAEEYCHELIPVPHRSPAKLTPAFFFDLVANLRSSLPYAVEKYRSETFRRHVEHLQKRVDLIVCDFLFPSVNLPARLEKPSVLFQHNVEAQIWHRHAETRRGRFVEAYFRAQWRRMRDYERETCRRFDAVVAVSSQDRAIMETEYDAPVVREVPTGVDTEYFTPSGQAEPDPYHLVFTGSMDWLPNDDAMKYFLREILPLIRQALPAVTLTIVGRNPLPGLRALCRNDNGIRLTGLVADVRPFMEDASVYVVPLRIGGGTRLKVFEAMAMERPIVSTTVGVEGLPVSDGSDVLLADDPRRFAEAVVRLLKDPALAVRVGRAGGAKVRAQFGWSAAAHAFEETCHLALERTASGNMNTVLVRG